MSNVVGNEFAVLVKTEDGYDNQSGSFVQYTYEGYADAINGALGGIGSPSSWTRTYLGNARWQLIVRFSVPIGAVTGTDPEVPVREERLRFNVVYKSIFSNPKLIDGIPSSQIKAIQAAVSAESDDYIEGTGEQYTQLQLANMEALYRYAVAGVDSFPVYQPVVIVTDTASASYPWALEFANYGYTFGTTEMIADAALVSGWKSQLPSDTSSLSGFFYGWLKKPPEIVTVGGNKTQLVQEYEYGLWADALFN